MVSIDRLLMLPMFVVPSDAAHAWIGQNGVVLEAPEQIGKGTAPA